MVYVAKMNIGIWPVGAVSPGEVLEEAQLAAMGEERVRELVAQGAICTLGEGETTSPEPAEPVRPEGKADAAVEPVDDNDEAVALEGLEDLVDDGAESEPAPKLKKGRSRK